MCVPVPSSYCELFGIACDERIGKNLYLNYLIFKSLKREPEAIKNLIFVGVYLYKSG